MLEELRSRTKETHLALDHFLYPYIQQVNDESAYAHLLGAFYGFFKPMQTQFDRFLSNKLVPDYDTRRKPEWILQDLEKIGKATNALPFFTGTPVLKTSAECFGAFYVLEGSTMGGTIISKKIRENLGYENNDALIFFNGYGENNRTMWNSFLNAMQENKDNEINKNELIDSTQNTFIKFRDWLVQYYG